MLGLGLGFFIIPFCVFMIDDLWVRRRSVAVLYFETEIVVYV